MIADVICQSVWDWNGASYSERREDLQSFLGIALDGKCSTCGLFVLACWRAAHVRHELLSRPYEQGKAMAWVQQIADDFGAIRSRQTIPVPGAVLAYYSRRPSVDDHFEICLEVPYLSDWTALHGGGGRENCGVSIISNGIRWNAGRPLQYWIDPNSLIDSI
jgi:hypothetical protein